MVLERFGSWRLFVEGINIATHIAAHRTGIIPWGKNVAEEDWDNLIVLDACRYDIFTECLHNADEEVKSAFDGELTSVKSQSCYTNQFLRRSFQDRDMTDTVYVTASPHLWKSLHGERAKLDLDFHAIYHSWEKSHHPEVTTTDAKAIHEEYPNKKLIVHYMSPHWPFIGEVGEEAFGDDDSPMWQEWTAARHHGETDTVRKAYYENMKIVLEHVADLIPALDGKTVVTSDHGQLLGETIWPIPINGYGHPEIHQPELVRVPWMEWDSSDRREITAEPSIGHIHVDNSSEQEVSESAQERLEYLGYK